MQCYDVSWTNNAPRNVSWILLRVKLIYIIISRKKKLLSCKEHYIPYSRAAHSLSNDLFLLKEQPVKSVVFCLIRMLYTKKRESAIREWLWQVKWVAWNNEWDVNLHSAIYGTIKCTTGRLVLIVYYFTQYEVYFKSKFHFTAKYILLTTQSIKCLYVLPFFLYLSYCHTTYMILGKWPTWCTNSFLCIYFYL